MTIVSAYGDLMTCAPGQPPCRADGLAMYNTAVAFSDDGSIIARYHKHHLFEVCMLVCFLCAVARV